VHGVEADPPRRYDEIRERLGLSRQRLYQVTSRNNFLNPVATLAQGKVWLADDVETWIREHRPDVGGNDQPSPST
jgi:predicted DNA-binding transcriptional regulator AlpA